MVYFTILYMLSRSRSVFSKLLVPFILLCPSYSAALSVPKSAMSSATTCSQDVIKNKVAGALLGFYIGDALAMPVHWYYDLNQLRKDFGSITKYEAPKPQFPGSIMNLSNTGGGGRGSDKGEVVGSIILHGKKHFWQRGGNFHYHHGMSAGENTLDALITRILTQSMLSKRTLDVDDFRSRYITFMTTPDSHNDIYAGTAHRMFFKNLVAGIDPKDCPDNDGHNVDTIDALMAVPPVVLATMKSSPEERNRAIKSAIQTTRKSESVLRFAYVYSDMLISLIEGLTMQEAAQKAGKALGIDVAEMVRRSPRDGSDPMVACYIDSSFRKIFSI